uniref:Uncharacterized protein n=1 Tax=Arundo donax TaxID=35708 RepID=A0A0A8ZHI1_ARUDO
MLANSRVWRSGSDLIDLVGER